MQRLLCALVAMLSLLSVPLRTTHAQDGTGTAVEPGHTPQPIDEPVIGKPSDPSPSAAPVVKSISVQGQTLTVGPEETYENVTVTDGTLVLQGHVRQDVKASNSTVTIAPTATVGGQVTVVGGHLENQAGPAIRVALQSARKPPPRTTGSFSAARPSMMAATLPANVPAAVAQKPDWFGGQFALLLLGLLGGAVASLFMPQLTERVAARAVTRPKSSLAIGGISALVLLFVLLVNAALLHIPVIRTLWTPIGTLIAFAPLLLLGFGWLAGMRYTGDFVARRFHRPAHGPLFSRIALGVVCFFLANVVLAGVSQGLGMLSFGVEILAALMGMGALIGTMAGPRTAYRR